MKSFPYTTALISILAVAAPCFAQGPSAKPLRVAATIGDRTVTEEELDALAADRLTRLKSEEYNIRKIVLDEFITRTLMEKEAKARGITFEQLEQTEITAKVLPVSEDQKRAVYETNTQQFQGKSEAEAFSQIEANLKRVRLLEARSRLLSSLRAKTAVKVMLAPPRTKVEVGDAPSMGPLDAAVTMVTFSDFQCPACGHALPTLKRLIDQYKGKIRFVFRDFPLPIHPQAPKAAEAGSCANEQGRFWEMHDAMFQNQQKLSVPDLKAAAAGMGLDAAKFAACLDSGKYTARWQAEVEAGRKYGVSATPTFFINGRMMSGSAPYQAFAQLVDEELLRVGVTPAPRNDAPLVVSTAVPRQSCPKDGKNGVCASQ